MKNKMPSLRQYRDMGFEEENIYAAMSIIIENGDADIQMLFKTHEDFMLKLCELLDLDYVLVDENKVLEEVKKITRK